MEAQLLLEILCGLACVIISLLMWIVFRTEKKLHDFQLCLEIMEQDLHVGADEMDVRKEEQEVKGNETDVEGAEIMLNRLDKTEEIFQNIAKETGSLQQSILDVCERIDDHVTNSSMKSEMLENRIEHFGESLISLSGRMEKLEKTIEGSSTVIDDLKESSESTRMDIQSMETKIEGQIQGNLTLFKDIAECLEKSQQDIQNLSTKMKTVPLHRYFNEQTENHFFTTNWDELGTGRLGYCYEGVAGFLMASPGDKPWSWDSEGCTKNKNVKYTWYR